MITDGTFKLILFLLLRFDGGSWRETTGDGQAVINYVASATDSL